MFYLFLYFSNFYFEKKNFLVHHKILCHHIYLIQIQQKI